jgi:hypothetical protein
VLNLDSMLGLELDFDSMVCLWGKDAWLSVVFNTSGAALFEYCGNIDRGYGQQGHDIHW